MPRKTQAEKKVRQMELDKVVAKEALREFINLKWDQFQTWVGAWVIRILMLTVFALIIRLFFWLMQKGYLKAEDFKS